MLRRLPALRTILKFLPLILLAAYLLAVTLPYVQHKAVSTAYQDAFAARTFFGEGAGPERVAYIDDNVDALLCRLNLIHHAQEELILSTFDFNVDDHGTDVMAALFQAAQRGVQVRVLVDGFSGFLDMRGDPLFLTLAAHPNIQLKQYNPIDFLRPWRLQARLHDKYLIADRTAYLLGGRNTTDLFLGEPDATSNIDRELLVAQVGAGADTSMDQLVDYFQQVWDHKASRPFLCSDPPEDMEQLQQELQDRYAELQRQYPQAFQPWELEQISMPTAKVSLLHNPIGPENKEPWMWYSLHQLMSRGKEVTVYTPYIICGKEMYQDLEELSQKGVSLEILTNDVASGANPWGCTDYLNQKHKIWDTGAKVYEYMGQHSCHTKAVLIDRRYTVLGSYNLDMRSTYQDTELMLVVDCPQLNETIAREAERDKTFSKTMGPDGVYQLGENYVPRELPMGKKLFYSLLRVAIVPLRRFL